MRKIILSLVMVAALHGTFLVPCSWLHIPALRPFIHVSCLEIPPPLPGGPLPPPVHCTCTMTSPIFWFKH